VLVILAGDDAAERERAYVKGALDVLTVPLDTVPLRAKLAHFLADFERDERCEQERERLLLEVKAARDDVNARHRSEFLLRAAEQLSRGLNVEATFRGLATLVVPALADIASVWTKDDEQRPIRVAEAPIGLLEIGVPSAASPRTPAFDVDHPLLQVFVTGKARRFDDYREWTERSASSAYAEDVRRLGMTSAALIPICAHQGTIGVIGVGMSTSGRRFEDVDIQLLEALGRQAGLAIENGRLFAEAERLRRHAEEVSMIKDQFLATVSHELRTPLTSILGWAKMIKTDRARGDMLEKGLDVIERNAKAQAQLIEDLLDVSRIVAGKLRVQTTAVFVPDTVEMALESARPAALAKGVNLETDIDPDVGSVIADPDRLQQIIWNLVANAVKFTPPQGTVKVSARRVLSYLEVAVTDTGKGIAPDFLPYVFERFRQATQGGAKSAGLGLGLAIVRHLVELHGGQVHAESEGLGKGSRFTIRLPIRAALRPGSRSPLDSDALAESAIPSPPKILSGVRVLVVDDEEDARELLDAILSQAGAVVQTAGSVDEALELLRREVPDALVSDLGMPVKSGYALIHQLRALPREQGGRIPAVALTAFARSEDRTRALTAGFTTHIPKPVEPTELVVVLANALGRELPGDPEARESGA
jgi:signal transduction histidine kinase/ActR/RegA family two-component response regulator